MKLKQYLNIINLVQEKKIDNIELGLREADQLEMQLAEPNSPLAQAFNGKEKLIKKYPNKIERYKGEYGSFRYILRDDDGNIIAAAQGVLTPPILSNIFVKHRRQGIGTKLLKQAQKDIKGLKISDDKTDLGKKFFK
jgi:hypothetical protein